MAKQNVEVFFFCHNYRKPVALKSMESDDCFLVLVKKRFWPFLFFFVLSESKRLYIKLGYSIL